jgi:hypothetical protein
VRRGRLARGLLSAPRLYQEEGADYCRPTDTDRLKDRLVQRLRKLGYDVEVTVAEPAA